MIVRIMGEGQYEIEAGLLDELNRIDSELDADIEAGNTDSFAQHLEALHTAVREHGKRVPDEEIVPSEIMLPAVGSSIEEILALSSEEGLIPDHGG